MTALDTDDSVATEVLPAAVLWDMDGTLVDTEPYWFAAERDLVESFGHEWSDEHAAAVVGFDLIDSARYIREHGHVPLEPIEIVERLLDGVIARLHRRIPWRPGARELLAELRDAGVPCALVTMSWRRFVDPVLAALPPGAFVASITGDEVPAGEGKPAPTPYLLGAAALGVEPADCLAIEDSPTGVRSALAAGCRVLAVPSVADLSDVAPARGVTLIRSLEPMHALDLVDLFSPDHPDLAPVTDRSNPIAVWIGWLGRLDRRVVAAAAAVVALVIAGGLAIRRASDAAPPLPPGAVPIDAWAPYWTLTDTLPETELRLDAIREMSPFWFGARGVDEIVVDEHAPADQIAAFVDRVGSSSSELVPSIRDQMPAGGMAAILSDPETRAQHIDTIVEFAEQIDADGIDLDYEQFAFADGASTWETTRPNWIIFVTELAERLHADRRTLTVSIPPVWDTVVDDEGEISTTAGYWVYDHGAIAEHVDAIRLMVYDYSVAEPGPIAPLPWVEDAVESTSSVVPEQYHHKLVLGVPSYGSNWVVSTLGECPASAEGRTNVTARSVAELAGRRGGVPAFDAITGEWSFSYALNVDEGELSCVQNRKVHWVDAEGVAARVEIARRAGWGGVALWALGYEDDEVWQRLVTASRGPLEP